MNPALKGLAVAMSIAVLLLFLGVFSWVLLNHKEPVTNEAVTYVWTAVSVLVGGIVAVAFGQPDPNKNFIRQVDPGKLVLVYAWTYFAVGLVAIMAWLFWGAETPQLVKNAATTFLGLMLPIVSAFLSSR